MGKGRKIMFWVLFLIGIVLLLLGLAEGGYSETLQKAKYICLECIGIG